MAYESDTVAGAAELLALVRDACTTHGWSLSGNILHKGSVYIENVVESGEVRIRGGTGKDGSNALTGAAPASAYLGRYMQDQSVTYPAVAEVHINTNPDEVYVVLNYAVSYYQFAAWGQSDVPGIGGSGAWCYASAAVGYSARRFLANADGNYQANGDTMLGGHGGAPLFNHPGYVNGASPVNYIHVDIDGVGWRGDAFCHGCLMPLFGIQPNAWNGETVLLPYQVFVSRASGNKVSLVADLKHMRNARVDYHQPGDIVTLGADQWKLYPWYLRNANERNGGLGHSGTLGYAIRYTP